MSGYFLYSFLSEAEFNRLNQFVTDAAVHVGVGAKLEGERHEEPITISEQFFWRKVSITVTKVTFTNVRVVYWREDNNESILTRYRTQFLDRLRSDEWHNAYHWLILDR